MLDKVQEEIKRKKKNDKHLHDTKKQKQKNIVKS